VEALTGREKKRQNNGHDAKKKRKKKKNFGKRPTLTRKKYKRKQLRPKRAKMQNPK